MPIAKKYEYKGEMLLATEIAERSGLNIQTVYRRIQTGKPLEDRKNGTCFYKGKVRTIEEVSKMTGLTVLTIGKKLTDKKPLDKVVPKKLMFKGKLRTIKEISELTEMSIQTIYQRIYSNKPIGDSYNKYRRKVCTQCKTEKPINKFAKDGKNVNGRHYYRGECKECLNKRRKESKSI